jgi:hypothetical protein
MQVSCTLRDRANFSDSKDIIFEVLMVGSSIVRSRKRKLRELFAVATSPDGIPTYSITDPDAQPFNTAESHFLERCDILKYV